MIGYLKTRDELFKIMKSNFQYAKDTYRVEIIAICMGNRPDGKKA
jgi:hypothetical protein